MKKLILALVVAATLTAGVASSVLAQGPAAQPACDRVPSAAQSNPAVDFTVCFVPPTP